MSRTILHIDMNSFFATVEQQANPRLRGKPIGITGGDRMVRTVLSTASVEAKRLGVKTGMQIWQAKRICPELIIVPGDSDKYLAVTAKFLNILKDYTPYLEVFSIDEAFLDLPLGSDPLIAALEIKQRLRLEIGEQITCSIGISYNKLMAKLAGGLQKPDGLVIIANQEEAVRILDKVELDDICGIGPLRRVPKNYLTASFKSYSEVLYNMARGIDEAPIKPFFEREEVKSVGHRHTTDRDTAGEEEIKQILLKLSELVAARLRHKKLVGKTIHFWYRSADFERSGKELVHFSGDGMQESLGHFTADGLEIWQIAWKIFYRLWSGEKVRMVGVSVSNLKPADPHNLSFLPEDNKKEKITNALDEINNKFGDFTLKRGRLLVKCFS